MKFGLWGSLFASTVNLLSASVLRDFNEPEGPLRCLERSEHTTRMAQGFIDIQVVPE